MSTVKKRIKKFTSNPAPGERDNTFFDSQRFNKLRLDKNLSLKDVATLSGVPFSVVSKISAGYTLNPRPNTVSSLAKALDTTVDYLTRKSNNDLLFHFSKLSDTQLETIKRVFIDSPKGEERLLSLQYSDEDVIDSVFNMIDAVNKTK